MGDRDAVPVDMVARAVSRLAGREMGDDLMPEEVEIHPFRGRATFGAAHRLAVKGTGGGQIVDGKGEMEGAQGHGRQV